MAAKWHILSGSTGAGKSTLARELVVRTGGVRFAIDEWMDTLYWPDCPAKDNYPWAIERVRRCEDQIASLARALAHVDIDVILDLGFTQRVQREAWLSRARATGVPIVLHVLDVPADLRWQRVAQRNEGDAETFTFAVPREMFDAMEAMWETPSAAERSQYEQVPDSDEYLTWDNHTPAR